MPRTSTDDIRFKDAEKTTRNYLAKDQYGVIRLDGRAFSSYTRGLDRPADTQFMSDMDRVAIELAQEIDGVRLAYVQSDEISLLLTDWQVRESGDVARSEFMFGGNIQKLVSISAAIASTALNTLRYRTRTMKAGFFDARAFSLPVRQDVIDYFTWRQRDAGVNALTMHASSVFSHAQLDKLSSIERRDLLIEHGHDPKSTPEGFRMGRVVTYTEMPTISTFTDKRTGRPQTIEHTRRVASTAVAPRFASDDSLVPAALPRIDTSAVA
jgi:tRNA(His) 5'-end guanylyltransferase